MVVVANVLTSNGVVHVVEGVLIPGQQADTTSPANGAKPTNNSATSASPLNSFGLGGLIIGLYMFSLAF
ncbi:hypothetical protein K7432_017705 [Basidiobolus ranarum]|uniref:FAS1 domain-containing protein n=1 Tax=Basidiobolus ranarum TaxID=34480 RepID=A0ABR2WD20_9FUNG